MSTSEPAASAAGATDGSRYRSHPLGGRPRLSALRRGTRQAVTSGSASGCAYRSLQRLAPPQPLLLASSSRPGRSAGEAGSEAARVQDYEPRTQAPHPTPLQGSSREAPPPNANHPAEWDAVLYLIMGLLSIELSHWKIWREAARRSRRRAVWMSANQPSDEIVRRRANSKRRVVEHPRHCRG